MEHHSVQNVSLDKWTNIIHVYKPKTETQKEKACQDNYAQNGGALLFHAFSDRISVSNLQGVTVPAVNLSGRATGDRVLHFRPDWMYGSHPSDEMPARHLKKKRRKKKKKKKKRKKR